uniref:Uncharacterized protein n=2 Tax=Anguilla anguilla TaxID=7936 RepID=A0A0E9QEI4_ANGAN
MLNFDWALFDQTLGRETALASILKIDLSKLHSRIFSIYKGKCI